MHASLAGAKQRWTVATLVGAVLVVALLGLFRLPPAQVLPPPGWADTRPVVKHSVRVATSADELLKDETELRDLRPLFLPTERNAMLPQLEREPGRTFLDDQTVKLTFSETNLSLARDLPPVGVLQGKPADQAGPPELLASEASAISLLGFGRNDLPLKPVEPRGGFVEVVADATGERVFATLLGPADAPPRGEKPWAPLEFRARVGAAGLAAPLVVTTSSGVEEIDAHFREFLSKTYRLGERLEPGFYRVIVAP